ncbi:MULTISPECIES: formate hydrogenlyase maturation HycH family protein [unclassified Campylobacter]|uniref:formate hydrogenlyase maturation HycH family protein n=1 Tax=unclassified Campylobacter TaxID=2593542 RepID=UPI0022EA035A|nr:MULTISPECIES: formate hydrogenlyase maturation HycH family protein [unclassified Campylobacter]MDA3063107.1 hypothetical protein [Campylobacter sp. JMF_14 EL1]MDA3074173.1 hypothetical protein [Campylobacter sp. JMF_10 EL2]WBR54340.1 hypothetical protein PF027_00305 [Campylobacter sp. VBCF_01 NA2]
MIEVWKLTKRHVDEPDTAPKFRDITIFTSLGHGVGTIDFSEKICEFSENEWEEILSAGDEYAKFKLGNIATINEIEIFPEHAIKLLQSLKNSALGEFLKNLDEGYLTLRKVFR